jgi:rubredoxin
MRFRMWYLYLFLGIVFAIACVALASMAATLYINDARGKDVDMTGDVVIFCCMPFFVPEALVFLALAVFSWARAKRYRQLASRLESYRMIKVSDLAAKMGKTEEKARKMVKICIKRKFVKGRLDQAEATFYSDDHIDKAKDLVRSWKCPACSSQNEEVILPGEMMRCRCGHIFDPAKDRETASKGALPPKDVG